MPVFLVFSCVFYVIGTHPGLPQLPRKQPHAGGLDASQNLGPYPLLDGDGHGGSDGAGSGYDRDEGGLDVSQQAALGLQLHSPRLQMVRGFLSRSISCSLFFNFIFFKL